MAKDTMAMNTLPQHVDDELRRELNDSYTAWRGGEPDGDIIDWLKNLPWSTYSYAADYDTDSKMWRAWVDFCIWVTKENRLVAEAAQKGDKADE